MTYTASAPIKKTIGILGGMGPLASANLYYEIIKIGREVYHAVQDTDHPPMIIYNLPVWGIDETGIAKPGAVKDQLIAGVKKLEHAACDFIIVACNSAHYFYRDMQDAVKIPILNMIGATAQAVKQYGYSTVGLLSSESTNKLKLYQKDLDHSDIKVLTANNQQQELLNRVILHVMAGIHGEADTEHLRSVIDDFSAKGAQGIILGCTDLPLAINQKHVGVQLFDCSEIVAKSALERALA